MSEHHFHVFVNLGAENERPSYHIVPSKVIGETIKIGHSTWLKGASKSGKPRKNSAIRNFSDKNDDYLEEWDFLALCEISKKKKIG
jgi:hypothetical protein